MPQSRARTAICSAPLEWPSRPGLPTSSLMRRPSRADTRSTSPRTSSRSASSRAAMARDTPVGARYSPNTRAQRRAPLAGGDAGLGARDRRLHDVAAFLGGALQLGQRLLDGLGVARRAPGRKALDLLVLDRRVDGLDGAFAGGERRGSVSVQRLTPTTICSPASILRSAVGVALDQRALHVCRWPRRRRPCASMRASSSFAAAFSSSTLRRIAVEPSKMSGYSSRSVS